MKKKFGIDKEKLCRIKVNPIRILQQKCDSELEGNSQFYSCLLKWKEMNVSSQFLKCQDELGSDLVTTAQLLCCHKHVAATLLRHLALSENGAGSNQSVTSEDCESEGAHNQYSSRDSSVEELPPSDLTLIGSSLIPKDVKYFMAKCNTNAHRFKKGKNEIPKALEPLLELTTSFAADLPQCFYEYHFYNFLPHIVSYGFTDNIKQVELVFSCITSLTLALRKFIQKDPYRLYTDLFTPIFLSRCHWNITYMAAQAIAFVIRKLEDKETFFYMIFKGLSKDPQQAKGLGKLLTAIMKHNSLNRVHRVTPEILRIVFNILMLRSVSNKLCLEAIKIGLTGLAHFVTTKNARTDWRVSWKEDAFLVWGPVWRQLQDTISGWLVESKISTDASHHFVLERLQEIENEAFKETTTSNVTEKTTGVTACESNLLNILSILELLISFKRGALLINFNVAYEQLKVIIDSSSSFVVGQYVVGILARLLKSQSLEACPVECDRDNEQKQRSEIIDSLFRSKFPRVVILDFVRQCFTLKHFEEEILPSTKLYLTSVLLAYSGQEVCQDVLSLVMDIVCRHQPIIKSGDQLENWQRYNINFSISGDESIDNLPAVSEAVKVVIEKGLNEDLSNCKLLLTAMICLPHITPFDLLEVVPNLTWILSCALEMLSVEPKAILNFQTTTPKRSRKEDTTRGQLPKFDLDVDVSLNKEMFLLLYLVDIVTETLSQILCLDDFIRALSGMKLISILKNHPQLRENEHLLRAIDIYLTKAHKAYLQNSAECVDHLPDTMFTKETFSLMYNFFAASLSSPRGQVRLLVTHILSLFPVELPPPASSSKEKPESVFAVMYQIESVVLTALNYNERLRLMSLLDADHIDPHLPVHEDCSQAPVLFAVGQFYVNLKPLWNYTVNYLLGFAKKLGDSVFWPLWFLKLKLVSHAAMLQTRDQEEKIDALFNDASSLQTIHTHLTSHNSVLKIHERADHINARNLMWRTMHLFPHMCEVHSRQLVEYFFEFMQDELDTTDFSIAPTANLTVSNRFSEDNNVDERCENEIDTGDDDSCKVVSLRKNRRHVLGSLCNFLVLFSKFSNLKSIYMSGKLEKLFLDLLIHPNNRVQKHALACIFAFKYKEIIPYQENLMKIHSDSSFKSGVTAFRVDNSGTNADSSVAEEHRPKLMPLYIRILYGKMQIKTGKNTSGRNKASVRKATIMRLLAGITEEESECLLYLVFEIILPYLNGSCADVVKRSFDDLDITNAVPPRRLLGMMGTIANILLYLGNLLPSKKPYFLKVILLLVSQATALKDYNSDVHTSYHNILKVVKTKAVHLLIQFFETFDGYALNSDEVDAIFAALIWPTLKKLPSESLNNIHPILRLFSLWSHNERHHSLFVKHHPDDKSLTPLPYVFMLVNQPKCKPTVVNFVLDIIANILGEDEDLNRLTNIEVNEEKTDRKLSKKITKKYANSSNESGLFEDLEPLVLANTLPVVEPSAAGKGIAASYGTKILLPHIKELTMCMLSIVQHLNKATDSNKRQLKILCLLSRYVMSGEEADRLLELIIPMLVRRKAVEEEVVCHLLFTCGCLLPVSSQLETLSIKMLPLFEILNYKKTRRELCRVFSNIADRTPDWKWLESIMDSLNSWESGLADSVDRARRFEAYQQLTTRLENSKDCFDEQLFTFTLYQCCSDIPSSDITLQTSAFKCLSQLIKTVVELRNFSKSRFNATMALILSKVRQGTRIQSDAVHCVYLKLLGIIVSEAGPHVRVISDLQKLLIFDHKVDFFNAVSNFIAHRASALSKLSHAMKQEKINLNNDTLESFVWPLLSRYLSHQQYTDEPGLLAASVDALAVVAKRLPWKPYFTILKHFLDLLLSKSENKRVELRVVSTVLDAFHEDVSGLIVTQNNVASNASKRSAEDNTEFESSATVILPPKAENERDARGREVYKVLVQEIIPSLKKVFTSRSTSATLHKVNKVNRTDNDDIKKIPLALPLAKLLKKFPRRILDANIGNVFYNLITLLQSHIPYVRRDSREMLVSVLQEVGSRYLPGLVRDLKANLSVGFQKHVFVYTIKYILYKMCDQLNSADLGKSLDIILGACNEELFKNKDVVDKNDDREKKIEVVDEAKGEKSFAIMEILGKVLNTSKIPEVFALLKGVLDTTHRFSVVELVRKCLENFILGLEKNANITLQDKSILIYGILTNKIDQFKEEKKTLLLKENLISVTDNHRGLEPSPKRIKLSAKTSSTTNSFVFSEFAFGLLNKLLRSGAFLNSDVKHCSLLDPYINLIADFVHCEQPSVTVVAFKALTLILTFPLPSLKTDLHNLISQIFLLLNKYSSCELESGDMCDMVQLAFRCMAVVINSVPEYVMTQEHMRVLLVYLKENIAKHEHQTTVFSLLQVIVKNRIDAPELSSILDEVRKVIVTDTTVTVLDQARSIYLDYITSYPISVGKFNSSMHYFMENVEYPSVQGKVSVCLMIDNFLANIPKQYIVQKTTKTLWMKLLLCLAKEENKLCRKHLQFTLTNLFTHSDYKKFLIKECLELMKDGDKCSKTANATNVHLGALSFIWFMECSPELFPSSLITEVLPRVVILLHPSRFVSIPSLVDEYIIHEQLCIDRCLSTLLLLFQKLFLAFYTDSKWSDIVNVAVWDYVVEYLMYSEVEVRMQANVLLGKLFASHPVELETCPPIAQTTMQIRALVQDLIEQFRCTSFALEVKFKEHYLMSVRNLIYLLRHTAKVAMFDEQIFLHSSDLTNSEYNAARNYLMQVPAYGQLAVSCTWVMSVVAKIAYTDINDQKTLRREALLNLIAGVVLIIGESLASSGPALTFVMSHIARETPYIKGKELEEFSVRFREVCEMVQERLGWEEYNKLLLKEEGKLAERRRQRVVYRRSRILRNPEAAEKQKQKLRESREKAKKRKRKEGFANKSKKRKLANGD